MEPPNADNGLAIEQRENILPGDAKSADLAAVCAFQLRQRGRLDKPTLDPVLLNADAASVCLRACGYALDHAAVE